MRYYAPDERTVLNEPTPQELEQVLRRSPHDYWQQGGNGEAEIDAGPGEAKLWIKQPEPARFFVTYSAPEADWHVPYGGDSWTRNQDVARIVGERKNEPRSCFTSRTLRPEGQPPKTKR